MPGDNEMRRLAELTSKYKALTFAEERAGKGDEWRAEYWRLVDSLVGDGLDRPLDDEHLIDPDFWSDKYEVFVHRHMMKNDRFYRWWERFGNALCRLAALYDKALHRRRPPGPA